MSRHIVKRRVTTPETEKPAVIGSFFAATSGIKRRRIAAAVSSTSRAKGFLRKLKEMGY